MTDRTSESLLARRALAEKATPGRWDVVENLEDQTQCSVRIVSSKHHIVLHDDWITFTDALFIVRHSPDVVMADIDEILRLREEVESLRREVENLSGQADREAAWLAQRMVSLCECATCHGCLYFPEKDMDELTATHWREAARKAVEENNEDKN